MSLASAGPVALSWRCVLSEALVSVLLVGWFEFLLLAGHSALDGGHWSVLNCFKVS